MKLKVNHAPKTIEMLQLLTDLQDERLAMLAPCESFHDTYLKELADEKFRVLACAIPLSYEVIK